jgi:hypothetical protein
LSGNNIDLGQLFGQVAQTLVTNKTALNKADTHNNDHGDNMADTFRMIAKAMEEKQSDSSADQLEYAAQLLRGKKSGSAQLYAKGFANAAKEFVGEDINTGNAMQLVQMLMGGGASAKRSNENPLGDMLGALMGSGASSASSDDELDIGDLLTAGMTFMSAKQQGGSNMEALMQALVADTEMSATPHRAQSSQLILNTLLDVVGGMGAK